MITYQWHREHPEDLFEFLEAAAYSGWEFELIPWGCRFTTANAPYKKQVVVDSTVKNKESGTYEWRSLEIDYDDIHTLEEKVMEALRKYA